jgi:uncharacterized protein (TIGR02246 family)
MPANSPVEVDQLFESAMATADLEAVVALYEENAVVPGQPGQPTAVGLEQVREAMRGFTDLKPTNIKTAPRVIAQLGDVAVLYNDWSATGNPPGGDAFPLSGKAIEVVRRQADGTWKFIFDDPNARG